MATDAALDRHLEDALLAREIERAAIEAEARELQVAGERRPALGAARLWRGRFVERGGPIVRRRGERRRIVQVNPAVGREGGVERDFAMLRDELAVALSRAAEGKGDKPRPRKR